MSKRLVSRFRLCLVAAVILCSFGGIGARLVNLQYMQHEELARTVESARKRVVVTKARRGNILDTNGNLLATSRSFIEVGLDPQLIREADQQKFPALAGILDIPIADVEAAARRGVTAVRSDESVSPGAIRWVKLHEGVDDATYDAVRALGIRAVYGNRDYRRTYPAGETAAHLIGFVNREGTPALGVEYALDFYLRGQDGWYESERDGRRNEVARFRTRDIPEADGLNAVLSVDMVVQHIVETELKRIVDEFSPVGATIIVSDPTTGFLLALANYPTFDLNHYGEADASAQRNRAIADIFEPGSTFKIVPASGALEEHMVQTNTPVDCSQNFIVDHGRRLPLPQDSHPNGILTVADVVSKSSNRGAAQLGIVLGRDRLYRYARAFGFGEETGIILPGEENGILHQVRNWDGLTITRLPMGHAIGATPLQIHAAMSAIANHGILMRPQIVRQIANSSGDILVSFAPSVRRRVVSESTARTMAGLLERVVSPEGTARAAAIPGFEVAGKTGTTQKIIDGRYSRTHHVGSFSGFFPASRPRVAVTVIIDDARLNGTAYGSTVAAPSFRTIAEQLIPYLGINPPEPLGRLALVR
ncbi:MAG: penicillin-binding protein 2 [Opitutaceae bacterium]